MALTSALFTGLSGLDVNQARLNVVGNNIANVNTVAFKSSRALFKTQFYVTDSAGSPSNSTSGGSNPSQRGLGATVGSIEKNFDAGSIEPTGQATDMALEGSGFFVVQGTEQRFTRDGSFKLNDKNQLVTNAGDFVQGFGVDANDTVIPGKLQNLTIPLGSATSAEATKNVILEGNLNANGVIASGASVLNSQKFTLAGGAGAPAGTDLLVNLVDSTTGNPMFSSGDVLSLQGQRGIDPLPNETFTVTPATTLDDLSTFFNQSLGIDTDPTLPQPGSTSVVSAGGNDVYFQITGNTGTANEITLDSNSFKNQVGAPPFTFSADPTSNPTGESIRATVNGFDSLGTPISLNVTAALESKGTSGDVWRFYVSSPDNVGGNLAVGNGTLTFDNLGRLSATTGTTITINRTNTGATSQQVINLDFSDMTALTSTTSATIKSSMVPETQDGHPIGSLTSFSIGTDGMITGSFTNGLNRTLGQVAVATFNNPQGLIDKGGNQYAVGSNSGVAIIGAPEAQGAGAIRSASLELSNVDLSTEFTNLIIATTGFSASSRVITTSDQLITELLNSNR